MELVRKSAGEQDKARGDCAKRSRGEVREYFKLMEHTTAEDAGE